MDMNESQRILHVDDDPAVLAMTRAASRETPFELVPAASAAEALAAVAAESFDAVVTDSFVTQGGHPLFRALRERDPSTPILLFTAEDRDAAAPGGEAEAVAGYVQKGGQGALEDLFACLDRLTDERSADGQGDAPAVVSDAPPASDRGESLSVHDWHAPVELGTTIVDAVATRGEFDVGDLDPLYEVVDPETLERLLEPRADGGDRGDVRVRFAFGGFDVAVDHDGTIAIRPVDGGRGETNAR
jgi:CheY-like chemotaxis protein